MDTKLGASAGKRLGAWAATLALALAMGACTNRSGKGRVIVVGLDGMDPRAVDLLLPEGKPPHFARLRRDGAHGRLLSSRPLLSPLIWTTIAAGKTPAPRGIGGPPPPQQLKAPSASPPPRPSSARAPSAAGPPPP